MKINQENRYNFTSRNAIIRKADDIARRINTTIPRISESHIYTYKNIDKFQYLKFRLREKTRQFRNLKSSRFEYGNTTLDKLRAFIDVVKEKRMGNCAESAQIAAIVAKLNGIDDAQIAVLRTKGGRKLDHAVLYVQNNNQPYIIDPWLGKADYAANMLETYSSQYKNAFDMGKYLKTKDMKFSLLEDDKYASFLKKEISNEDKEALLKLYPQLLV